MAWRGVDRPQLHIPVPIDGQGKDRVVCRSHSPYFPVGCRLTKNHRTQAIPASPTQGDAPNKKEGVQGGGRVGRGFASFTSSLMCSGLPAMTAR